MKRTIFLIFILLFQFNSMMFSQSKKVKTLKKEGRDSLIEQAVRLTGLHADLKDIMISVKANKTSLIVSFHQPVIFLPINSVYKYGYCCDLANDIAWSSEISNPEGFGTDKEEIPDYCLTDIMKEQIKLVFDAINESKEIGNIKLEDFSFDDQMIIQDNKTYYDIKMWSPYQKSFYKIDKKTGEVYDAGHGHFIPDPSSKEDEYKEIE